MYQSLSLLRAKEYSSAGNIHTISYSYSNERIRWLIDFKGLSAYLVLFYANKLKNRVHCPFILTFLCRYFLRGFLLTDFAHGLCTRSYWIGIIFKQIYLIYTWDSNRFCGPGINRNEKTLHTRQGHIQDIPIWRGGALVAYGANVLDCDIVVSKFELPSHHYIHFQINTHRKGMNHPTPIDVC